MEDADQLERRPGRATPTRSDNFLTVTLPFKARVRVLLFSWNQTPTIDYSDPNLFNWVYRKDANGKWRAELIDWESFTEESDYKHYTSTPEPFVIDPTCGVFVPTKMKKWVTPIES